MTPLHFCLKIQKVDQLNVLKIHLTTDQARHIYKKVELEGIVNVDTVK